MRISTNVISFRFPMARRVVVTGVGIVSPLGVSAPASWRTLISGGSGLVELPTEIIGNASSGPDSRLASAVGGLVPPTFDNREFQSSIRGVDTRRMARFTLLAMAASQEALVNANLFDSSNGEEGAGQVLHYNGDRCGCAIGSGIGSLEDVAAASETLRARGPGKLSPFFVPRILANMAAGHVSITHGLRGPSHAASTACATGAHAIGDAYKMVGGPPLIVATSERIPLPLKPKLHKKEKIIEHVPLCQRSSPHEPQ